MHRVGCCFAIVFLLSSSTALAQLNVGGPGLALVAPLRVVADAQAQPTIAHFVFENTSDAKVTLTPSVQCPPQTLSVALIDVAIDVPAGAMRLIQVRFADPEGGAQAGEVVECLLFTGVVQLTLFVQLVAPATPPSLGSLSAELMLMPEGVQTEAVHFLVDATSTLRLNVNVSGLTLGADVGWGVTGLEFAVLNLKAFLGALDVLDQVVFAVPFGLGNQVLANGVASLVKTRLQLNINLFGLSVQNLFLFENTKFKHPFVDEAEALDATQTPSFRFGDLVSFSGQPGPGETFVRLVLGLCADPARPNTIKKRVFFASVCDMDPLQFNVIQMSAGPFTLMGQLLVSGAFELRPNRPLRGSFTVQVPRLLDLFGVSIRANAENNVLSPQFTAVSLGDPAQAFSLQLDDRFRPSSFSARLNFALGNVRLRLQLRADPEGLRSTSISLNAPLEQGALNGALSFTRPAPQQSIVFQRATVRWSQDMGPLLSSAQLSLGLGGLQRAQLSTRVVF